MVELSVLVPVKNERENILPLLQEIHAALEERCEFEVIYINDGSTDRSPNNLSQALKTYPRLRVLTHAQSCGQSAALMSGVRSWAPSKFAIHRRLASAKTPGSSGFHRVSPTAFVRVCWATSRRILVAN